MAISRSKENLNSHLYEGYNQIVELKYSKSKNYFFNSIKNSLNNGNDILYRLKQKLYSIKTKIIFARVKSKLFNINIMKLGANQIQLVDLENHRIMHLLIPGTDKEWLLKDIKIRKQINEGKYNIKTPIVYDFNTKVPYFITDYIEGVHPTNLTNQLYEEITLQLFRFYSEQNELIKKDLKLEFEQKIEKINKIIGQFDKRLTANFQYKFTKFIKRIRSSDYYVSKQQLLYVKIVHGDLNYCENIIRSSDGVLYYLDWELSRPANILYDFFYMLIYEISSSNNFTKSNLGKLFVCKKRKTMLQEKILNSLGININENQFIQYLMLTVLDMLLYKILIIKKKRLSTLVTPSMIKKRFTSFEKNFEIANNVFELVGLEKLNEMKLWH